MDELPIEMLRSPSTRRSALSLVRAQHASDSLLQPKQRCCSPCRPVSACGCWLFTAAAPIGAATPAAAQGLALRASHAGAIFFVSEDSLNVIDTRRSASRLQFLISCV